MKKRRVSSGPKTDALLPRPRGLAKAKQDFPLSRKYILKLLEKCGIMEWNSVSTPMDINFKKLFGSDVGPELANPSEYRQLVGALIFLVNSQSDICFVVNTLSEFMVEPHHVHWVAAENPLRYLIALSTIDSDIMSRI